MIPFRTTAPCHASPVVTMSLIVANIAVFFIQKGLGPEEATRFIYSYALVPAVYGNPLLAREAGLDPLNVLPFVTNTFMHGGYLHLILNMWTLWLFGLPVEDRLGPWRFLLFYLGCGLAGGIGHVAFNLDSVIPTLGASGAVAGVLAGFVRLFPREKVALIQPIFIFPLLFHLPAIWFTALWFGIQVLQGAFDLARETAGGIAWWAHVGGFVAGFAVAKRLAGPHGPGGQGPPGQGPRGPWKT